MQNSLLLTFFYPMSTSICNSCGLPGHQRISHRNCLNNPNRLTIGNHNETEEREFNFVQTSTAIGAPICSSCGQEGHQRVTHRDCLNNPNRLAIRERNENDTRDLELVHESSENAVPVCSSCGQEGHTRVTHRDCLNNPNNRDESETVSSPFIQAFYSYSMSNDKASILIINYVFLVLIKGSQSCLCFQQHDSTTTFSWIYGYRMYQLSCSALGSRTCLFKLFAQTSI